MSETYAVNIDGVNFPLAFHYLREGHFIRQKQRGDHWLMLRGEQIVSNFSGEPWICFNRHQCPLLANDWQISFRLGQGTELCPKCNGKDPYRERCCECGSDGYIDSAERGPEGETPK